MSTTEKSGQLQTELAVVVFDERGKTQSGETMTLREAGGRAVVAHVVAAAQGVAGRSAVYVVTNRDTEKTRAALQSSGATVLGVSDEDGDAVMESLRTSLAGFKSILLVPAGMARLRTKTLDELAVAHVGTDIAMTILTGQTEEFDVISIPSAVCAIKTQSLLAHLEKLKAPAFAEDVTGGIADALLADGEKIKAVRVDDDVELTHVDSIASLVDADREVRRRTTDRLMAAGVTIFQPETCVIDADVEVAPEVVIEPFVQLLGQTKIGPRTRIRSYSVVENCVVGSEVIIRQSCVLADSSIANHADIGPFARMRPGCEIGEHVHIGNFVEVKKSKLHAGVKAGHLAYLGDSIIGAKTNIGAGVITCNYDGVKKHQTIIGEGAFIGSDSTLVAPVTVGDGAYVGAGSCITREVPADALAVGRSRQVIKDGWAAVRRKRKSESAGGQ